MRGSTQLSSEVSKDRNRPVHLCALELRCSAGNHTTQVACELDGGTWNAPIYLTDYSADVVYNGNTYLATNDWLGISDIVETAALQIHSVTMQLSGIDQTYIALLMQQPYIDKPITIHRAFLNDGGQVAAAIQVYYGYISSWVIEDDNQATSIAVEVKSRFQDFDKRVGRRTNNAENQHYYPGDTSMSHADEGFREFHWGRAS